MDTIKSNEEISRVFSKGRRLSNRYVNFIYVKNKTEIFSNEHDPSGRVAFIAGKKLGGAVWRNSAKRRMREIYRECRTYTDGLDILFIAKAPILSASYSKVLHACKQTMKRIANEGR